MIQVRKRNGKVVDYDAKKIFDCIKKANADSKDKRMNHSTIWHIVSQIEEQFENTKAPSVESIQDAVENTLMKSDWQHTARSYIVYRAEHAKIRDTHEELMEKMMEITFTTGEDSDYKRSNANIHSDSVMGSMLLYGTTISNFFNDNYIIPKKYIDAHREGKIHIHDKDFSGLTQNCLQIDLQKTFKGGFAIGGSYIREPQSIRAAASLGCIVLNECGT